MHSKTPSLGLSGFMGNVGKCIDSGLEVKFLLIGNSVNNASVPAVAAISPGCKTFNESALFG